MFNFLTDHLRNTVSPQTYCQHFFVAFFNSIRLLWAAMQGIIHSFFPWWYPFATSTRVIKTFKMLAASKRHQKEMLEILGEVYETPDI